MDSIGETLRRERLRRGLKLDQVATQTKIGQHLLRAMEEDRFDRLPGGLFTRSFLRQYTRVLDLNADDIIVALKQLEEPPVLKPEPPRQYNLSHLPHLPTLAWLAVSLVACGGIYALWENVRRSLLETSTYVRSAAGNGGHNTSNSRVSQLASAKPHSEDHPMEDPVPGHAAGQISLGPSNAVMRVVFAATEPVWLAIKSDGNNAYSGTLEGQQSKEFDASSKMTVLVGNAGGLAVSLNGKPIALSGAHGEVRSLVLTPSGVQVLPRTASTLMSTPQD